MEKPDTIRARCRQYGTALLLVLAWCMVAGSGGDTREPRLTDIRITPESLQIARGQTGSYQATGRFEDGTQKDITQLVSWISSDERIAAIENEIAGKDKDNRLQVVFIMI